MNKKIQFWLKRECDREYVLVRESTEDPGYLETVPGIVCKTSEVIIAKKKWYQFWK